MKKNNNINMMMNNPIWKKLKINKNNQEKVKANTHKKVTLHLNSQKNNCNSEDGNGPIQS